ncbi:MAG: hypothetical protein U0414_00105 [Polyangiaceae bacterium]
MEGAPPNLGLTLLGRALEPRERARLVTVGERLLEFHRRLSAFPSAKSAPVASPVVALYREGKMLNCALSRAGGSGAHRLKRAFLASSGPVGQNGEPVATDLEITYGRAARWLEDPADVAVGEEGLALIRDDDVPVLLMPSVAREWSADPPAFLELLRSKAGSLRGRLAAWSAERIVARVSRVERDSLARAGGDGDAIQADYAAAWLARMVGADGAVTFALDPRRRILQPSGELHHARSAVAIEALARVDGYEREVRRARAWLAREIRFGLAGDDVPEWPRDPARVAGTLALAACAGVHFTDELIALAERPEVISNAWHAAQVALALGPRAPDALLRACADDRPKQPFAPWTVLAARALGDRALAARAAERLAASVRLSAPHVGGAGPQRVPETGLTAVAAHALAGGPHEEAHEAALAFVRRRHLLPRQIPAILDPRLALGGFSATPVDDTLRADIAGHALLALLAADAAAPRRVH